MITNTCKNCGFQISYNHPCGHFEEYCPMCTLRKDYLKKGVYETRNGAYCFYCILDDNVDFGWDCSEIEEYEAYQIGYNDGYDEKDLPEMNCRQSAQALELAYEEGRQNGKKLKDTETKLEDRTEAFCTLLPDFLAKENIKK